MENKLTIDIQGAGIAFPFQLRGLTDIARATGNSAVKSALSSLVLTAASNPQTRAGGQRSYNRRIGVNIYQYLFTYDNPVSQAQIKTELKKLEEFEKRVIISDARVIKDDLNPNLYLIPVMFIYRATMQPDNLVVPILTRENFGVYTK